MLLNTTNQQDPDYRTYDNVSIGLASQQIVRTDTTGLIKFSVLARREDGKSRCYDYVCLYETTGESFSLRLVSSKMDVYGDDELAGCSVEFVLFADSQSQNWGINVTGLSGTQISWSLIALDCNYAMNPIVY